MTTLAPPPAVPHLSPAWVTVADLLVTLGGVPADRVRFVPQPGTATEQDVIDLDAHEDRLYELVDGVLVEKPMGFDEGALGLSLGRYLLGFVEPRRLGWVSGADGMMRIVRRQVRMPDVAYVSRERAPGGKRPKGPIAAVSPDLAVEVLSASNTPAEMARKRREYFEGGTRLVWEVDPVARTVAVFTSPDAPAAVLSGADVLDGGDVLPGFTLPLADLFRCLDD
jgi:Uma2 family endonuclease